MKIQCSCGTKYSFEATPEMARTPMPFVCQNCGADNSVMVNQLIRQQFGVAEPLAPSAAGAALATAPAPTRDVVVARVQSRAAASAGAEGTGQVPPPPAAVSLRTAEPEPPSSSRAGSMPDAGPLCLKHVGKIAAHKCLICQKPMCPECMQLFGYVCSPLCRSKAEAQGMTLPAYESQQFAVEAKQWRKITRIAGSIAAGVLVVLGVWFWYAWFATQPSVAFSARFAEAGYSGQCRNLAGNQLVLLHNGILARHDTKLKKEIWTSALIDKKKIADEAAADLEQMKASRERAIANGGDTDRGLLPTIEELTKEMERYAAGALHMHGREESVWVSFPDRLVRYDWQTGKSAQEIAFQRPRPRIVESGDELLLLSQQPASERVTHVSIVSGESRQEELPVASAPTLAVATNATAPPRGKTAAAPAGKKSALAGAQTLNPEALARKAQGMSRPARLALPAVVAANANQERALKEMQDEEEASLPVIGFEPDGSHTSLIPDGNRFVQFSVKLVESKVITRQAMKAPPKKSALDGDVTAASTTDVANEILNEMQRDRGGDVVEEDASRYQVTLNRPGVTDLPPWVGEVTGRPEVFVLKTVDVLAAGKSIVVVDKTNKKLWESKLNFPVAGGARDTSFEEGPAVGEGPAVERGDTLYVFDQGVLSAFELATGNARWRLPCVGVAGLHFDDRGMIYVNASSASPDTLRYPNQIDLSEKSRQVIFKLDGRTGATLWKAEQEGLVSYVSGKFVYSAVCYHGDDGAGTGILGVRTGLEMPSHVRLKRLDPGSGRVLWEHYQERVPLDLRFEKNAIYLLFRKEMQVLRYFSF